MQRSGWMPPTALLLATGLLLCACQKQETPRTDAGPAEQAGRKLDQAASQIAPKLNELGQKAGQAMQDAGQTMQQKAREAQDKPADANSASK